MTTQGPQFFAGPQQRSPLSYPEGNYQPGNYPEDYFGARSPRRERSTSRYEPGRRERADSGTAPPMQSGASSPRSYNQPPQQQRGISPYASQSFGPASAPPYQTYFPPEQMYAPQPQPQGTTYPPQPQPQGATYPPQSMTIPAPRAHRPSLHPDDAYSPRAEVFARQGRPRVGSDANLYRPSHLRDEYDGRYSDDSEEDERAYERRQRERRRRRSEGSYDQERRRERHHKDRKEHGYHDKRPTLADSTIWAFQKAKNYVTTPY